MAARIVVDAVENGYVVEPFPSDGRRLVATDLDGLLDVLHTVFEQEEGPRGAPFVVSGAGPSSVEEAAVVPQGDPADSAEPGEADPSSPPPSAPTEGDMATPSIEEALGNYPAFVKDPKSGRYTIMCPDHGSHTAQQQGQLLVCTGKRGGKWCTASIPMALVRQVVAGGAA